MGKDEEEVRKYRSESLNKTAMVESRQRLKNQDEVVKTRCVNNEIQQFRVATTRVAVS